MALPRGMSLAEAKALYEAQNPTVPKGKTPEQSHKEAETLAKNMEQAMKEGKQRIMSRGGKTRSSKKRTRKTRGRKTRSTRRR